MPKKIEKIESELEQLHQQMSDPEFYTQSPEQIKTATDRAEQLPQELDECFERWEELEARQAG